MIDTLTSTPFFGLGVTLLCWDLAAGHSEAALLAGGAGLLCG